MNVIAALPTEVWLGAAAIGSAIFLVVMTALYGRVPKARGIPRRSMASGDSIQALTERAGAAASRMISAAQETRLGAWLERAGLDLRPGELVVIVTLAVVVVYALVSSLASEIAGVVAAGVVVLVAKVVVDLRIRQRQKRFGDQLGDTLILLAGTLRAGYGTAQALEAATRESEPPTSDEFRRLVIETRLGRDFIGAMRSMATRVGSQDLEWVIQAFEIHADVGGDLADVLETVAGTIRERTRLRRQVQVLSAEGVLSAIILFALPIIVATILSFTNPDYLESLFGTTRGQVMLAMAAVLQVIGGFWLRYLVKPRY